MTTLVNNLLVLADQFAAATKRSRARVSTLVFNDGKRLSRLSEGFDIGTRTFEAAVVWFSDHWPEGLDWPEGIPRPARDETEAA